MKKIIYIVFKIVHLLTTSVNCFDEYKNQNIIIIGAGSSGIAAATKLLENGFTNIKIFEAENRIGGRINTIQYNNNTILELGAARTNDAKNNAVYNLSLNFNLLEPFNNFNNSINYKRSNGYDIPESVGAQQFKIFTNILSNPKLKLFNGTIGEFVIEHYRNASEQINFNETLLNEFLNLFQSTFCMRLTCDNWQQETGISYGIYQSNICSKPLKWKRIGFKIIFDILMKKYPDASTDLQLDNKIYLNKCVKNIITENNNVRVITFDAEKFNADKVIVTVPLGVLKEKFNEMFKPILPLEKQLAIQNICFGKMEKLFIEFESPWWPTNWDGIQILWRQSELQKLNSSNIWLSRITGFFPNNNQSNILLMYVPAIQVNAYQNITDARIKIEIKNILKELIRNKFKLTKIINVIRTKWYTNKNFRGAYSYHGILAQQLNITSDDLATPIKNKFGKNVIYFAGEATHKLFMGTVNGAIQSGWRVAQEIINDS